MCRLFPIGLLLLILVTICSAATRCVDVNSPSPAPPYTSWPTAARVIQDAVDVSVDGDLIQVTNGIYQTGGRTIEGETTGSRVALTKAVMLQSVNGPGVTIIRGYQVPGTTNGPGAIRCAYLTNGAALFGFTLTNGSTAATNSQFSSQGPHEMGGGAECRSIDAVVSNCIVVGNSSSAGGGATCGTWNNCVFSNNVAASGGGAFEGLFENCLFVGNQAICGGGLALNLGHPCWVFNCTIVGNSAISNGGGFTCSVGMIQPATFMAYNSIILSNSAPSGGNYSLGDWAKFRGINCCTEPTSGPFNFTFDPFFVDPGHGDFRLQSNSPCINAGNNGDIFNVPTSVDLAANPRISGGTIDVGAYEFQNPPSTLSYAWAQQFGIPTDGSADYVDPDADGLNNWQEWQAGTDPTNAASVLKMLGVVPTNNASQLVLTWQSVVDITYVLQFSTNLASPFTTLQSNLMSSSTTRDFIATNATPQVPVFYRVGIQ